VGEPTDEACNGEDDDCDGRSDEGFRLAERCDGVGACGAGVQECADAQSTQCSTDLGGSRDESGVERCNGQDDDCDGRTDEAFDLTLDDENCGRCGSVCGPGEGCVASECAPVVAPGYVRIEAGAFWMGSPEGELGRDPTNETRHRVTLSRAFALKVTEVTQAEWRAMMGNVVEPSFVNCGDACPMESVSWEDAVAYCNALSQREGLPPCYGGAPDFAFAGLDCAGYRLPTEAEWEYAARAGTQTAFYTGPIEHTECDPVDPNADRAGWHCGNAGGTPHPVASPGKAPNAWGLYDMHGNVWEWVNDWYDVDYGGARGAAATDPLGPASGELRVNRGGGWINDAHFVRSAYRGSRAPADRLNNLGFRPSRSL
jgi:formylglycine-generating enzyme required for sulfatase activity